MNIGDINTKISFLTKADTTDFDAATRLVLINNAYNRVTSLILQSDGRWQWDDNNQTDFPIATCAIVSGQQDYSLSSAHLRVIRVEVKDTNGNWSQLKPYDNADYDGQSITQLSTQTGLPTEYDVLGLSLFLLAVPNYSQAASIKVYFQRGPVEFTSAEVTAGTKEPGFVSLFHDLIPLLVAYEYAVTNGQKTASGFLASIQAKEAELVAFYSKRNKDDRARITTKRVNPR